MKIVGLSINLVRTIQAKFARSTGPDSFKSLCWLNGVHWKEKMQKCAYRNAVGFGNDDNSNPAADFPKEDTALSITLCACVRTSFYVRPCLCETWICQSAANLKAVHGCVGRVTA